MTQRATPVIGFAGYSGSGKTTLAVQVVAIIRSTGYKVAVVKHDAHGHYREASGSDSGRYVDAGADAVVIVSKGRTIHIARTDGDGESSLDDVIAGLSGYDLIVVEGFKAEPHPKIVVYRNERQAEAIESTGGSIVAYAAKEGCVGLADTFGAASAPVLNIDDAQAVAQFILHLLSGQNV